MSSRTETLLECIAQSLEASQESLGIGLDRVAENLDELNDSVVGLSGVSLDKAGERALSAKLFQQLMTPFLKESVVDDVADIANDELMGRAERRARLAWALARTWAGEEGGR